MARKTNKTAHVLNLLASGTSKSGESEQMAEQAQAKQPGNSSSVPNIAIIDKPTGAADPLAGLIKESLNKEISIISPKASEDILTEDILTEDILTEDIQRESEFTPAVAMELPDEPAALVIAESEVVPSIPQPAAPVVTESESVPPIPQSITPAVVASFPASAPLPKTDPAPTPNPVPTVESLYNYINMMELLLDERHLEFMHRFDTCTCERCTLDIKALALSNLPPKYLVMPKTSIAPLTSYYRNKYNILIVTELTKACLAIINEPRH